MATRLAPRWLEGKTTVIVNASSELGQAFALALARRGAHLILVTRQVEQMQALAATLSQVNAVAVQVLAADGRHDGAAQQLSAAVKQGRPRGYAHQSCRNGQAGTL